VYEVDAICRLCTYVSHLKRNAQKAIPTEWNTRCVVKCYSPSV
jgi:hypothetical protein